MGIWEVISDDTVNWAFPGSSAALQTHFKVQPEQWFLFLFCL